MRRSRKRKWLTGVAVLLAMFAGTLLAAPRVLNLQRVHDALERRFSAALGRPVEAGRLDVSFIGGPRIVAENVSVAEDPRFGYEDFLRAPEMAAGVRWQSLLVGRLEFGTIVLTRPSFNVVRAGDGTWNLRTWLPAASGEGRAAAKGDPRVAPTGSGIGARLARVEIDGGRINFKRGVDKIAFALTNVDGFLERRDANAWQVDLRAVPMRAGIAVQEPGVIEVLGVVRAPAPGTSPADVSVAWAEASLSDALRLTVGHDYGVRGGGSMEAQIRWPTAGSSNPLEPIARPTPVGSLTLAVRLAGVHRWDLPSRTADPALNLRVQADWVRPLVVNIVNGVLEAPGSNVRFSGWLSPGAQQPGASLRVISSAISLGDLFNWYRAFRPGVSDAVTVEGHSGIDLEVLGWPPRLERAVMASGGATVRLSAGAARDESLTMGRAELRFSRDARRQESTLRLQPVTLTFGDPRRESAASSVRAGTLRVEAAVFPARKWQAEWAVAGQTARAEQWWAAAGALGIPHVSAWAANGWGVQGPAMVRMRWSGSAWPLSVVPEGLLDLSGARVQGLFMNQPARLGNARLEIAGGERRVTFSNAQVLGATWNGTLRAKFGEPWQVALNADELDAAELDRWLNPGSAQASPGILARLGGDAAALEVPAGVRAAGRLSVAQLTVGAMTLRRVRGNIAVEAGRAWQVRLNDAQADFFGGNAQGDFTARYDAGAGRPEYRAVVNLTGVNVATVAAASTRTEGLFQGLLAGSLNISAAGAGRDALLGSLEISGAAQIRNARTRLADLPGSLRSGELRRGSSEFPLAEGEFGLDAEKRLQIASLRLTLPVRAPVISTIGSQATIRASDERPLAANQVDVYGNVEWFGVPETRLSLDIFVPNAARNPVPAAGADARGARGRVFQLRGTLAAPQLTPAGQQ